MIAMTLTLGISPRTDGKVAFFMRHVPQKNDYNAIKRLAKRLGEKNYALKGRR